MKIDVYISNSHVVTLSQHIDKSKIDIRNIYFTQEKDIFNGNKRRYNLHTFHKKYLLCLHTLIFSNIN